MIKKLIVMVLLGMLVGCSITNYRSYDQMPMEHQAFIPKEFLTLKSGMSVEEVREIMGQPDEESVVADVWFPVKGEHYNQLKILYVDGKAVRAYWLSIKEGGKLLIFG